MKGEQEILSFLSMKRWKWFYTPVKIFLLFLWFGFWVRFVFILEIYINIENYQYTKCIELHWIVNKA